MHRRIATLLIAQVALTAYVLATLTLQAAGVADVSNVTIIRLALLQAASAACALLALWLLDRARLRP